MTRFIVDGYNLLFRLYHVDRALKEARQHLLSSLSQKAQALSLEISIVFDAAYQEDEMKRSHLGPLELIFTQQGESADEWIVELASQLPPSAITVVTSDKQLARYVGWLHVSVWSVEQFAAWIASRYQSSQIAAQKQGKRPVKKNASSTTSSPKNRNRAIEGPSQPLPSPPLSSHDKEIERYLQIFQSSPDLSSATPLPKKEKVESEKERWNRLFEAPLEKEERQWFD